MSEGNGKRDEHRRQKRLAKQRRKKHVDRDRARAGAWSVESPFKAAVMIDFLGPTIEAAGSLDAAIKLGLINAPESDLALLRRCLPKSRGGLIDVPGVDADWEHTVAEAAEAAGYDIERQRKEIRTSFNQ